MKALLLRLRPLLIGGGARLFAAFMGLACTSLAAGAMGPGAWGVWVVVFALFGWAQHVAEWGLRNVALVEGGRLGGASPELVRAVWRARLGPLVLAMAGLAACIQLGWSGAEWTALWLACSLLAISLNLDWVGLTRGDPAPAAATLALRPCMFLLVIWCLPAPLGLADLAFATFAGWAGAALVGVATGLRALRRTDSPEAPAPAIWPMLRAGIPYFCVTLANQFAQSADLFAVAWMLGAHGAGTFGLVATIAQTATFGAQASAQWWLARACGEKGARLGPALAETGLAGLAVAVLLMTAGPPLLRILFGHAWSEAADLLPAAGLYVAAAHLTAVLAAWASARGDAGKVAAVQLATQALSWPVQLAAAAWSGMTAVLVLRGVVELVRAALLLRTCSHRHHAPKGEAAAVA